jgi:hypothetical protein
MSDLSPGGSVVFHPTVQLLWNVQVYLQLLSWRSTRPATKIESAFWRAPESAARVEVQEHESPSCTRAHKSSLTHEECFRTTVRVSEECNVISFDERTSSGRARTLGVTAGSFHFAKHNANIAGGPDWSAVKFVWSLPVGGTPAIGQLSKVPFVSQADSAGSPARRQSATAGPPSG